MALLEIISAIGSLMSIAQPVVEWGMERGKSEAIKKVDISKAYQSYKTELNLNCAILEHINLDSINTRDIADPAVKGIASRLKTNSAEALLTALLSNIQNPKKAAKAISTSKSSKINAAEAKKLITAIISVMGKTKELQCFTTLSEAERKILKGFYARARIKHIKEKSLYIKQNL